MRKIEGLNETREIQASIRPDTGRLRVAGPGMQNYRECRAYVEFQVQGGRSMVQVLDKLFNELAFGV